MYEFADIIEYNTVAFGNPNLDKGVKKLADIYKIGFNEDLQNFTDQINFLIDGIGDRRKYRKSLQVFQLCTISGGVSIRGKFGDEVNTLKVDEDLFRVLHNFKEKVIYNLGFFGMTEKEMMTDLEMMAEQEEREETLLQRKIIRTLVFWLRGRDIFKTPNVQTNIGNKEGAFIYDLMALIDKPIDKYFDFQKQTNKLKRDAVKSYLM